MVFIFQVIWIFFDRKPTSWHVLMTGLRAHNAHRCAGSEICSTEAVSSLLDVSRVKKIRIFNTLSCTGTLRLSWYLAFSYTNVFLCFLTARKLLNTYPKSLLFKLSMLFLLESFHIILKKPSPIIHISPSNVCRFVICSHCFAKLLILLN